MSNHEPNRRVGASLGIITFLAGVALLIFVFKLAYDVFAVAPEQAMSVGKGETLDVNQAIAKIGVILVRVIMLLVMAILGGAVANRGIKMFTEAGIRSAPPKPNPEA